MILLLPFSSQIDDMVCMKLSQEKGHDPISHLTLSLGFFLLLFFYRLWNKLPKIENMPSIAIDKAALSPNVTFVRWKVHHDWVTQVTFSVFTSTSIT